MALVSALADAGLRDVPEPQRVTRGGQNDRMEELTVEAFVQLETEVWEALIQGDADGDARLLSEDFLGVYPSGFADRSAHVGQLDHGSTVADYELSEARIRVLSPASVLLSYRADWRRASGTADLETMFVTSVWCRNGARWENVFSQDTPAATGPVGDA